MTHSQLDAEAFEVVGRYGGKFADALTQGNVLEVSTVQAYLDSLRRQSEAEFSSRPVASAPRVREETLGEGTREVVDHLDPYRRPLRRLTMEELLAGMGGDGALFALYVSNVRRLAEVRNQDACIAITGYEGSGKSTFGLKLARWLQPGFTAEQVCFDAESMLERIQRAPRYSVVMLDEAVNGLYAREAMAMDNRVLTTAAMVARARNLYWILCIPHMHNLDPYFREHRVRSWWHVIQTGETLGHVAKRSPYYPDTYWDPFMRYQYGRVVGLTWDTYDANKQRYILDKLEHGIDRAGAAREKKGTTKKKVEQ